jgi:TRAM domain-containing protein
MPFGALKHTLPVCRTKADSPEIDGYLIVSERFEGLSIGDIVQVEVDSEGEYDLHTAHLGKVTLV